MRLFAFIAVLVLTFLIVGPDATQGQRFNEVDLKPGINVLNYTETRVATHKDYEPRRDVYDEISEVMAPEGRLHMTLAFKESLGKFNAWAIDGRMKVTTNESNKSLFSLPKLKKREKRKKYYWQGHEYDEWRRPPKDSAYITMDFAAPPRSATTMNIKGKIHARFLEDFETYTTKELANVRPGQTVFEDKKLDIKVYARRKGDYKGMFVWEGELFRISKAEWINMNGEVIGIDYFDPDEWDGTEYARMMTEEQRRSYRLRLTIAKKVTIKDFKIDVEDYKLP